MKNNKGFTLIELISILVLIAIVATLSFQVVANRIKKSKQRLKDTLYAQIEEAASKYMPAHPDEYSKYKYSKKCITIKVLQDNGYLEVGDIKNPVTGTAINEQKAVSVTYDNDKKQYIYYFDEEMPCNEDNSKIVLEFLETNSKLTPSEGLYEDSESYVYRGANPNNYIKFENDNVLWRIINIDKETKYAKIMRTTSVGDGYQENGVIEYLNADYETNTYFSTSIKNRISTNSKWNTGVVNSEANVNILKSLEKQQNSYYTVGLLSMSDFKNSFIGATNSYLKKSNESYFLLNKTSSDNLWILNNNSLTAVQPSGAPVSCKIYPVVYLNLNARILEGNGTETNPYVIDL